MSLLVKYHLYIIIAVLVGLIFLPTEYRKSKLFTVIAVTLAFSVGYELAMKEPVTKMPGRINQYLNQKGVDRDENPRYYQDPVNRSKKLYNN